MRQPETLWQAEAAAEYHLFRNGLLTTRDIAERLDMEVAAARRMLARMGQTGRAQEWDGLGEGGGRGCPSLWSLPDQPDPMDPEKRHKADLDGVPTEFYKLNCARMVDGVYTPYNVLVTVVEIAPRRWRAFSSEWGLGKPGYPEARAAAMALAANVSAHIVPEAGSVTLVDAQFGFEVNLAS